jgi:autotransporter strand-loop-strand O-heptosyltransferase|tara:strand:- start:267 stop:1997 length:1731 start_codon:yes stop_codon:yes gene_type:complete
MPYSRADLKLEIQTHFDKGFSRDLKILDVGPGAGMYGGLLSEYSDILDYSLGFELDCLEIYPPYIEKFKLKEIYKNVFIGDICTFNISSYDYIILGDVLEHLSIDNAKKVLNTINKNNQKCMVAVPYLSEQGEHEGNIYEAHLQPDLTPEIMKQRYPSLKLLYGNDSYGYYVNYNFNKMKETLVIEYNNLFKKPIKPIYPKNEFKVNFIKGCKFEVIGENKNNYHVEFINQKTNKVIYETDITNNMWTKPSLEYFVDFKIRITDQNNVVWENKFNAENKRVYIHFASNAIGDTLAWFPYAEEFRKKHKCKLIVSTFWNDWFKDTYPNITFVEPGEEQHDLYAMYEVGWHYNEDEDIDYNRIPSDFRKMPLSKTAADQLGLEYREIKPKLSFKKNKSQISGDYVVIAPHASSHAKYWNYKGGWQTVVDYLNDKGYKVVMITKEPMYDDWHDSKLGGTLKGVINKTGNFPLDERANDIMNAKALIGIGSGLSWLSWALGTPVVMISGFSEPYSEFEDCERIYAPKGKCGGCFNKVRLDAGDWEWCPEHKDTDRHFECTTSIKPQVVIDAINRQLEKTS